MHAKYDNDFALLEAARRDDINTALRFLDAGANPNAMDIISRGTSLQIAAAHGNLEMARALVQHGADVNLIAGDAPTTALEVAAIAGRAEIVEWLLQAGAIPPTGSAMTSLIEDLKGHGETRIIEMITIAARDFGTAI